MPENVIIDTDSIEITFDTSVRHMITPTFAQAEQVADSIIEKTKELQDPYYAFEALRQFDILRDVVGLAKAKVLHFLNQYWEEFQIQAPFMETITMYSGLTSQETIKRYIRIWDMFDKGIVPSEYIDKLKSKPINELVPVMGALKAGYELTDENWQRITEIKTNPAIARYIRDEVKATEPRSNAINYVLDKSNGMLYAKIDQVSYRLGRLVLQEQEEPAKRAISRLIETLHVRIVKEEENE